jgi:N utilization substance protein A
MQPIYTDDELAEIEENELEEEMHQSWNEDVDYEEYDSYYDDEY